MLKRFLVIVSIGLATSAFAQNTNQQNTNSQTTRTRTVAPKPSPKPKTVTKSRDTEESPRSQQRFQKTKNTESCGQFSPPGTVLSAFNALLEGIRHADVKAVTNAYQ